MASRPEQIEEVIDLLLSRVAIDPVSGGSDEFEERWDIETIPSKTPASTLRYFGTTQTDFATGGISANEWRWLQMIWLDNSDPEKAQTEWKRLSDQLNTQFRNATPDDLTLGDGTPVELSFETGGAPLEGVDEGRRFYAPVLYITARTEEV